MRENYFFLRHGKALRSHKKLIGEGTTYESIGAIHQSLHAAKLGRKVIRKAYS